MGAVSNTLAPLFTNVLSTSRSAVTSSQRVTREKVADTSKDVLRFWTILDDSGPYWTIRWSDSEYE